MLRTAAFTLTILAVIVLLGSLVLGLRGGDGGAALDAVAHPAPSAGPPAQRIRVEVLNGAGVSGLAARVTDRLRDAGFDVVYYGNAGPSLDRDSTTILDRAGNDAAVAALAAELGLERIESAIDTSLYVEATLVLGDDYTNFEF